MYQVRPINEVELLICNCIISYPHLFTPRRAGRPGQESGDPKFSADLILPADLDDDDMRMLRQAHRGAAARLWPTNRPQGILDMGQIGRGSPWKDPTQTGPQFQGRLRLTASSRQNDPPRVLLETGPSMYEALTDQTQIFAGCVVHAHVRFYAYNNMQNGIACGLNAVVLVDNMNVERIDGRTDSAAAFASALGQAPAPSAPAPLQAGQGPAVGAHQAVQGGQQAYPDVQPQPVQQAGDGWGSPQPQQQQAESDWLS